MNVVYTVRDILRGGLLTDYGLKFKGQHRDWTITDYDGDGVSFVVEAFPAPADDGAYAAGPPVYDSLLTAVDQVAGFETRDEG